MHDILLGKVGNNTAAYLENIIPYTKNRFNNKQSVNENLKILSKRNLWLKPGKFKFWVFTAEYLGLIISYNGIQMYPTKVK